VYEVYQRRLNQAALHDVADISPLFLQMLQDHPLARKYDDIIVDEAQYLTPMDLRAIYGCLADFSHTSGGEADGAHPCLLLLGEATQMLTARAFFWKQAGVQAHGYTVLLCQNDRNTRQIAEAAAPLLLHNRLLCVPFEYIDPAYTRSQGPLPTLLSVEACSNRHAERYAQIELVKDHILDLVRAGSFRLSDIAIVCYSNDFCLHCQSILRHAGIPAAVRTDPDFHVLEEQIKVLTIYAARSLEFPVVFLVGLVEGELPVTDQFVIMEEEKRQMEIERERMLCYVGMTRAAELLYLVTVQGKESRFLQEMGQKIVE
jgi:superfamily I DNA/RNA helicase